MTPNSHPVDFCHGKGERYYDEQVLHDSESEVDVLS